MNVLPSSVSRLFRTASAANETANTASTTNAPASRANAANPMQQPATTQRLAEVRPLAQPQTEISVATLENWAKPNGTADDVSSGAQAQRQTIVDALLKKQKQGVVSVPELKQEVGEVLEQLAADINWSNENDGSKPIHIAAFHGHSDCLALLIYAGADPDKETNVGAAPAHIAAFHGHTDCLAILIEAGADLHKKATKDGGATPAFIAALHGRTDCLALLINADIKLSNKAANDDGATPALIAAHKGHTDCLILLHNVGVDLSLKTPYGTPLSIAERNDHIETANTIRELVLKSLPKQTLPQERALNLELLRGAIQQINTLNTQRLPHINQPQIRIDVQALKKWALPNGEPNDASSGALAQRESIVNLLLKKQHNGKVRIPGLKQNGIEVLNLLATFCAAGKFFSYTPMPNHNLMLSYINVISCADLLILTGHLSYLSSEPTYKDLTHVAETTALKAAQDGNTNLILVLHGFGVDLGWTTPNGSLLTIAEKNGHTKTANTIRELLLKSPPILELALHQSRTVSTALLNSSIENINTLHDLTIALQLVSKGLGLGDIALNDDTRQIINEFFWAAINNTEANDESSFQGIYYFAAQVYQAKAMSEFHFGSIENHLKTNLRLNHLEQDVTQIKQVFTQQALQIREYAQQLNQQIRALSDAVAEQHTTLKQLTKGQQLIADKMLQIGQSLRTARQIGTLTKVASSVVALAPVVGAFVGGLFEAGFKLQGLAKAKSLMEGLAAFKEQVADVEMPENVQALTLGMIIPELAQHEAYAELADITLKTLIEAAGTTAQTYYENQMEKIALSVHAPAAKETEWAETTTTTTPNTTPSANQNLSAAATAYHPMVLRAVNDLQSTASQLIPDKKAGVHYAAKFSAALVLFWLSTIGGSAIGIFVVNRSRGIKPANDLSKPHNPLDKIIKSAPLVAQPLPGRVEILSTGELMAERVVTVGNGQTAIVKPTLLRQDSGLDNKDGNNNRLAASIKANNSRIFARELRKAIAADLLNAEVQRSDNADIHSSVLDIAAHYGRLDMAEAIEAEGGESLRHGDPVRALLIAENNAGQYDAFGNKIEA